MNLSESSSSIARLEALRLATRRAVCEGPGHLPAELRAGLAAGDSPEGLGPLLQKVRLNAYKVSDADIAGLLREQGGAYSQDEVFELMVSTVVGAAQERLEAAMAALEAA